MHNRMVQPRIFPHKGNMMSLCKLIFLQNDLAHLLFRRNQSFPDQSQTRNQMTAAMTTTVPPLQEEPSPYRHNLP